MAAPPKDSSVTETGDRPSRRDGSVPAAAPAAGLGGGRRTAAGHERGRRRRPAIPPSTASAVPVTDAASGLAR